MTIIAYHFSGTVLHISHILFNPYSNLIIPIFTCKSWNFEMSSDLPKVTQLLSSRAGTRSQSCLGVAKAPRPMFLGSLRWCMSIIELLEETKIEICFLKHPNRHIALAHGRREVKSEAEVTLLPFLVLLKRLGFLRGHPRWTDSSGKQNPRLRCPAWLTALARRTAGQNPLTRRFLGWVLN